ncbi:DMT family transporter [Halomonas sp. McH1-25]|uniref:DMT family transporter n=1 Tax=unclassified Halomonas TaxID=2609666 RepID=UPI001EF5A86A|nr:MULTISPECIES: DMT family transporter [unclassified Halomonas]MCG7602221.1 DMT family transporter [Halomonas sp. McH1-25]MCP1344450.1 DMT family transporter [Halomonas sp. FL8]MCP1362462.1 DMT family transporter [Halomonas sp. BBD45]MCP1366298.1 DMT family transporter [Halomonas sp. BBD48]
MANGTVAVHNDRPLLGIGFMLLAGLLFVLLDSMAKTLGQDYSSVQVVWARFTGHVAVIALYLLYRGGAGKRLLISESVPGQFLRGVMLLAASTFAYTALAQLPLLQVHVVNFTSPLLVTVLAVPLLGEKLDIKRGIAVLLGFSGVIVAIGPTDWRSDPVLLYPFGMAFCFALYQLSTRRFGRSDAPLTSLFYAGLAGALISSLVVPFFWTPIATQDLWLFLGIGLLGAASQFGLIQAMRFAPASLASPFLYAQLIWSSLFGFLLFGDVPSLNTYLGAILIVAAGLYIATRRR